MFQFRLSIMRKTCSRTSVSFLFRNSVLFVFVARKVDCSGSRPRPSLACSLQLPIAQVFERTLLLSLVIDATFAFSNLKRIFRHIDILRSVQLPKVSVEAIVQISR